MLCISGCSGNGSLVKKDNFSHNFQCVNQFGFVQFICLVILGAFIMFSECLAVFLTCGFAGFLSRQ